MVGLELKREALIGELSDVKQILMPALAAVGGMIMPALIYAAFNQSNPEQLAGWAIPAATDIAFALGVLSLLGNRVPNALKVFWSLSPFLMTLVQLSSSLYFTPAIYLYHLWRWLEFVFHFCSF